jgi:tetratricopeptide (TPR) repeat protein
MTTPTPADGGSNFLYRCTSCRLTDLKQRSQIDFEIEFYERILNRDPHYVEVLMRLGELFAEKGWHRRTLQVDQRLADLRPRDEFVIYNLACSHAVLHHVDDAMRELRRAVDLGFSDYRQLMIDPDLASLRLTHEFVNFARELQQPTEAETRLV